VKHAIRVFALACALVTIAAPKPTAAQKNIAVQKEPVGKPASLRDELLEDWTYQKESILKLVNYMPADKYDFTPPMPPQRFDDHGGALEGFGKRVLYIAQVNVRFLGLIGGKATPPPEPNETMTSKDASMKAVEQSYDYGIALLQELNDQTLMQTVTASFLGEASRARIFTYLIGHAHEIDGQLVLYERMAGVALPFLQ
jgi:hypothetical protein